VPDQVREQSERRPLGAIAGIADRLDAARATPRLDV
jgi:hypothetical protein